MGNNKTKLSELTLREITDLEIEAFKDTNKCRMSLVQIGKKFLSHALKIDVHQCSFSQVRNEYIESSDENDISENENEFYKKVAEEYLWLTNEPRDKLLEYFYQAKDDLKKINFQLSYINTELNKLENKKKSNGWLNGEDRYDRNLLEYYKEKNKSAKNEILEFISEDIEFYALNKCHTISSSIGSMAFFTGRMPYRYSRGLMFHAESDMYDVRNMTKMSNKFLNLPVSSYREVKKLYEKDKNKFYLLAKEYISGDLDGMDNVFEQIKDCIERSHIIAARKDIILTILKHYRNGDFISVVNILPMQIEGIFHDICLEVGINESKLDISSINEKLRIIQSHINHFIYFEYYSFKFPVIRNMVAHGKLIEGDIEHTAIMLMLDLLPVCELSLSEEIPVNKKICLLKKSLNHEFDSLIELFDYRNTEIPNFYKLNDDIDIAMDKYNGDDFWDYLEGKLKKDKFDDIDNSKTMRFIKKLHSSNICKNKSSTFLKMMPNLIEKMKKDKADRKKKLEPFIQALAKN